MVNEISIAALDLIVGGLERELNINASNFKLADHGAIMFFDSSNKHKPRAYVHYNDSFHCFYVALGESGQPLKCERPGFFKRKPRVAFDDVVTRFKRIKGRFLPSDLEKAICDNIPSAKDIIAEKALVGDHGGKDDAN